MGFSNEKYTVDVTGRNNVSYINIKESKPEDK